MKNRVSPPTAAGKLTNRVKLPACCAAIISTALLSLFAATPALAGQGYEKVTSTFGEACKSSPCPGGEFNEPTAIAVNDETEDVYVLDSGNDRVEWFTFNAGTKSYEYAGQFNGSGEDLAVEGKAAPTGKFLKPGGIAVDQTTGDVYVADTGPGHEVVDKFSAIGKYEGQLTGTCTEAGKVPPACEEGGTFVPFVGLKNVTVDPAGDVWVYEGNGPLSSNGEEATQVDELSDAGSAIEMRPLENDEGFDITGQESEFPGFAVDSSGDVYVVAGGGSVYEYVKASGNERVELAGSSELAQLAIIPANNDLLVDEGSSIEFFKSPLFGGMSPLFTFPGAGLSESAGIAVDGAKGDGTVYATQRGSDDVDVLESGKPEAPEIVSESASSVSGEDGELTAVIDPENRTTTYTFEYASTEAAVLEGEGEKVSGEAPAEFGDETVTSPAVELSVVKTTYYRVVAENEESKGTPTVGKVEAYTKLPLVGNEKVSNLTSTGVKLEATVNPVFVTSLGKYYFEYAAGGEGKELLEKDMGTVVDENPLEEEVNAPLPVGTELASLIPGRTYYYRLVAENEVSKSKKNANKGEPVRGPIEHVTPYGPPAIVTDEAQSITRTAATLSGTVNPERTEATYYFAYIGKVGYEKAIHGDAQEKANPYAEGETTATFSLAASGSPQAVGPIPADDLLPGVTYHYALVATNKFELQTIGPDQTFTTRAGAPPLVSTGGASAVSQNAATLSGTVTTNGLQTNYGFEIGTAPGNYGPATGLGAIGGAATEEVHVTLGELAPGTTYYYQVTATNADGTTPGEAESFTTPGFPTLLVAPASPAPFAFAKVAFPKEEMGTRTGTTTKALTTKQKLAKALKVCGKKPRSKRAGCERQARRKYGPVRKRTKA